jgi:hypothetical protein
MGLACHGKWDNLTRSTRSPVPAMIFIRLVLAAFQLEAACKAQAGTDPASAQHQSEMNCVPESNDHSR